MDIKRKLRVVLTGVVLAVCAAAPVLAEDIEIYTSGALGAPTIQPNVMFIVDTSGSMNANVVVNTPYVYTTTYAGSYSNSQIYFSTTSTPPSSTLVKYSFDKIANKCDASVQKYDLGVIVDPVGPLEEYGFYSDQIAQFKSNAWSAMNSSNNNGTQRAYFVECKADAGLHGQSNATNPYIINNAAGWTNAVTTPAVWASGANVLFLFDGNYLNFLSGAATTTLTRMQVAKDAVKAIVDTNNNINICLMRFDGASPYEGGPVIYPCEDVKASRNDFKNRLGNLTEGGYTPLSETYYEALLYFGGKEIVYGNLSNPSNQTGTKENGNPKFYETPIIDICQKNYIIYLTDGAPTRDYISSARRTSLATTFPASSCNTDADPGITSVFLNYNKDAFASGTSTRDNCLDELAGWALKNDVAERVFAAHNGTQTITTYTVGFDFDASDPDLVAAEQLLRDTATAGGGRFYEAVSKESLLGAFNEIVAEILAVNSTFSSPAVSVNAFNRATNLDDLYFTLFKPAQGPHWDGNLKKFKLAFDASKKPFIADQFGVPAIDVATGFFKDTITSYWTQAVDAPDGGEAGVGGAASMLTLSRNMYTYTGTYINASGVMTPASGGSLLNASNALVETNAAITHAMLGVVIGTPADVTYPTGGTSTNTVPYRTALLMWARGNDILDNSPQNSQAIEPRRIMGDPLHSEPALVQYGLTGTLEPDLVAYVATNDGYLHAINTLTGVENFSFVPQELLPNLNKIFDNSGISTKSYGLDGNVVPWINDVNKDGTIGAGDTVYLYVGMRRGGRDLYSLDVSTRTAPALRWKISGGTGNFAELGQTWSTPNVAKLKLSGVSRTVLIFGAGYDTLQDSVSVRTVDTMGRGIYIVDALTGAMLWRAGPDIGASTQMTDMKYSIPGRVKPLDLDGDGYIDRLYAGDMGGQLWRFDIKPSDTTSALSTLITGGRIADLASNADATKARRFYYPPDAALIAEEGKPPYISLVAVSGYRAHPLNTTIRDRAYMIRDTDVYNKPANTAYAAKKVVETDLYDATMNLIGGDGNATQNATATSSLNSAKGWYISLEQPDGSFIGEKGLAEPLILKGQAIFTTYVPQQLAPVGNSCKPNDGTGILYFVNVKDATPISIPGTVAIREDRKRLLTRGGIPPSPTVIVTEQGESLCVGTECEDAKLGNTLQKSYWFEKQ